MAEIAFGTEATTDEDRGYRWSRFSDMRDALASLADYREAPRLDTPATPERVLLAAEALRSRHSDWPPAFEEPAP